MMLTPSVNVPFQINRGRGRRTGCGWGCAQGVLAEAICGPETQDKDSTRPNARGFVMCYEFIKCVIYFQQKCFTD